jgi:predicted nucleic acid-binding protein
MQLPDVNVLIYAHREGSPEHERYAAWLQALTASAGPFALSDVVATSRGHW